MMNPHLFINFVTQTEFWRTQKPSHSSGRATVVAARLCETAYCRQFPAVEQRAHPAFCFLLLRARLYRRHREHYQHIGVDHGYTHGSHGSKMRRMGRGQDVLVHVSKMVGGPDTPATRLKLVL